MLKTCRVAYPHYKLLLSLLKKMSSKRGNKFGEFRKMVM